MPALTAAAGLAVTYRQQYRRCGSPRCHRCAPGAPGHGPYWYAFWAEGGRTRSRYLGKERPPEAGEGTSRPGLALVVPAVPSAPGGQPLPPARRADRQPRAVPHLAPAPRQTTASTGRELPRIAPGLTGEPEALPTVPPLRVQTLGGFAVWRGEEALAAGRWARGKVGALLKLLLSAPRHTVPAEQAIDRLWPEADPAQGAANLRSTIRYLRAALDGPDHQGASYLRGTGATLALDPAPGGTPVADWLDADTFARRARAALGGADRSACHAALSLYGGTYLPDDPYEDWAEGRRTQLAGLHERLLLHLAGLATQAGDATEAVWALRAVLAADPCQEEAAQALMRVLLGEGRPAEALRVYQGLARALREELAVAPARETEALKARIHLPAAPLPAPVAPNNLPAATTSFVGREAELAALEHALLRGQADGAAPGTRLLTLVGVGGTGKTRLGLALAEAVLPAYPDGVWLVELAPLPPSRSPDPTPIVRAAVAALGLREQSGQALLETLVSHLRERRLLLVLDNCEHLVAAGAALAARLLAGCRELQVLVTSREALGMAGETLWPVPPLALPPEAKDGAAALEQVARAEAVALFVARARAVRPGFALSAANAGTVAQVCRRLDGLPLAIELAAARLQVLGLEEVAARLDDRFRLLRQGNRAALPRHQTLRAALDWSYDLLSEGEQRVLAYLSVFAGGWTLAAAAAVCAGDGLEQERLSGSDDAPFAPLGKSLDPHGHTFAPLDPCGHPPVGTWAVLDALDALVSKSLVQVDGTGDGAGRYRLLETVRQYAAERLDERGERAVVRDRHLSYFLALAEEAEPALTGAEQSTWLDRLAGEHDNLRAALGWVREQGWLAEGLRLAAALWRFWQIRGHYGEGRGWLAAVLAGGGGAPMARAKVLYGAGIMANNQGAYERAAALLEESLARYRELGDQQGIAESLNNLGWAAQLQGDYVRAETLLEESLAHHRTLGDRLGIAALQNDLGWVAYLQRQYGRATALIEESLALYRQMESPLFIAYALVNLGWVALAREEYGRATALHEQSLQISREVGSRDVAAEVLEGLTWVAAARGQSRRAALLGGAAEALWEALGSCLPPGLQADHERVLRDLRLALGEEAFATAWAEGRALPLEQVIALALEGGAACPV